MDVVLLHGGGLDRTAWDATIAQLGGCTCHAPDQRGHGDAAWAPSYDLADYVADIAAWAAPLNLDRPVIVGHSMGARNAFGWVLEHDVRPRAMIVVDMTLTRADVASADRFLRGARKLRPADARYDPAALSAEWVARHREQAAALIGRLDEITCPVTVVHGRRSRIITHGEAAAFAAQFAHGELVELDAGHNVMTDQPAALADLIRRA